MSRRYRTGAVAAAGVAVAAALILTARRAADAPATSDLAVIELYTWMASRAQLLVGAYSRFQWHHPGPLYFYLLAPFYLLGGGKGAALNAGAAALSIASISLIVLVLVRRSPRLAALMSAFMVLFAWRAGEAVASPWNPHVPLLPSVALIVVTADVLAGRAAMLPVAAALASLAGQAHIGLMPMVLAMGGVAAARAVVGGTIGPDRARWRRSLLATTAVLCAAWALPLYEQVTGVPRGNMTELWAFFLHRHSPGQPLGVAVSAWSDMMVGIFRPDFYVARGWPFVESPVRWAEWLTLIELGMVTVFAGRALVRRDRFGTSLGGLVLLASAIALWSATRISEAIFDHDVFWMTGLGLLAASVAVECLISVALPDRLHAPATAGRVASLGFLMVAVWLAGRQVGIAASRSFEPTRDARIARALAADLDVYMRREGVVRPLVKIDQDAWGFVAGAILDLQKRGRAVAVEEDWVVMFTPRFRPTGEEDAVITVATAPEHLRLADRGVALVSSRDPVYAHASRVRAR